jgi:AcrR family transcriptional regulator
MKRRHYTLGRRGEAAEETRQRIVEATFALHSEQGIAETSMKQIAARAGVSIGAVYHHFPTYEDAVRGCAAHAQATFPLPPLEAVAGDTLDERVGKLARAVFGFYARLPVLERVRCDAGKLAPLAEALEVHDRHFRTMISAALGPGLDSPARVRTVAALLDFAVHAALTRDGLTTAQAADDVATVILAWLRGSPGRPDSLSL